MFIQLKPTSPLARLARRFGRDERGVALVEAAFIFPLMILLYVGSVAVTMGVTTDRKLTLTARSLGDIVAQSTNVTTPQIADIFGSARAVMAPYDASSTVLKMRVSSVRFNAAATKACVAWSIGDPGHTGWKLTDGEADALVPADLRVAGTTLVVPQVEYTYTPVVGSDLTGGAIVLKDVLFVRPRQSSEVTTNAAPVSNTCT
jgi:Flp pilus assembly protein TadG